ncbi:MBL fold metallo-hydrolase [Halobacteriovorax sp. HLS]|uniref:MBL fold metallo-hydrolase n=1 Tax=Halobacteriovorax sp. HLS TaxID=2234000 RepID=UPI000FD753CC|nr:MBL fold metallo-hydrolase [Halobacteriovorax sp. HLS]
MKISFLGATKTVTGSKYLIEAKSKKFLVDCGLYQGQKEEQLLNRESLGFMAKDLDAIFLTHGHLDHCGMIPKLVKEGFQGKIFATAATIEIAKIILIDSAKIQESDASKYTSEKNPLSTPLYDAQDVQKSFELFSPVEFDHIFSCHGLEVTFRRAGHILGASCVYIKEDKTVLFSGDLGRLNDPLMPAPSEIHHCDLIVMESTYGNRIHSKKDPVIELEKILERVVKDSKVLLVPSFAVARAQLFIHYLSEIFSRREDLKIPAFVNSPMTNLVTEVYRNYSEQTNLTKESFSDSMSGVRFLEFSKEYSKLNKRKGPLIIIAASGMVSGGRVLEHLDHFGKYDNNIVLLIGYQGEGTIGHDLQHDKNEISLLGHKMTVKAQVNFLENLSAHADQSELLEWLSTNKNPEAKVVLVHGDEQAQLELKSVIEQKLKLEVDLSKVIKEIDC